MHYFFFFVLLAALRALADKNDFLIFAPFELAPNSGTGDLSDFIVESIELRRCFEFETLVACTNDAS